MTGRDILMAIRRKFTAGYWCRGSMQRVRDDGAYNFCLVGALGHEAGFIYEDDGTRRYKHPAAYQEAQLALRSVISGCLIDFNDSQRTAEPVIERIDLAIEFLDRRREDMNQLAKGSQPAPDVSGVMVR